MSVIDLTIPAGVEKTTEDLDLYLSRGQGFNPNFGRLIDHSLGDPSYVEAAAINVQRRPYRNGRKVRTDTVLRGTRIMRTDYEVNLPEGYDAILEIRKATRPKCRTRVLLHDPCERSFDDLGSATFDEVRRRRTPIDSPREDGAPLEHYTMLHGFEQHNRVLMAQEKQAAVGFNVLALDFKFPDCSDCGAEEHQLGLVAGAVWTTENVPHIRTTEDQFATLAATTEDETDNGVTDIFHDGGNVIFATYADDPAAATATEGFIKKSVDGGTTWTTVYTATEGVYAITRGRDFLWAFGGDGLIVYSESGEPGTWTVLANTATATFNFYDCAFEPKSGTLYAVGDDDTDGKAITIRNKVVTDISAAVGTLNTNPLKCVTVLSYPERNIDPFALVAIGGDAGFYSENRDAENASTWTVVAPFTSDDIGAIEGSAYRTFVGAGAVIFERAIYTRMAFEALSLDFTISGDISAGATGLTDIGTNYVAFGTTNTADGEIIMLAPKDEVMV